LQPLYCRTGFATPSGTFLLPDGVCNPVWNILLPDGVCNPVRRGFYCRTGFATPSGTFLAGRGLQPRLEHFFATPSGTFLYCQTGFLLPDGVCNPVWNISLLSDGVFIAGRGLQPRLEHFFIAGHYCRTGTFLRFISEPCLNLMQIFCGFATSHPAFRVIYFFGKIPNQLFFFI